MPLESISLYKNLDLHSFNYFLKLIHVQVKSENFPMGFHFRAKHKPHRCVQL